MAGWFRRWHRWLALATAVPFGVVVATGCLLQAKRWIPAIQPPSTHSPLGSLNHFTPVTLERVLLALRSVPEAQVQGWEEVAAVDVRPALGVARARTHRHFEVQVDLASGAVLSAAPRRTSWLVSLHEGTFFGPRVRDTIFFPSALAVLGLTLSGFWLLIRHYFKLGRPHGVFIPRLSFRTGN